MRCQKSLACLSTLTVALFIELLSFSLAASQLRAQSIKVSVIFPPTEPRGAPPTTMGGGTRRGPDRTVCFNNNPPLRALTPTNNVITTVSANPALFWYVPKTEAKSAEFVLFDSEWNELYKTTVAVKGTPGIVKLSLPESVDLETGKKYQWKFSLICDDENWPDTRFVTGLIERTELNLEEQIKLAATREPLKQAEVYAEAAIWQETLSLLAQLRYERPNDLKVNNAWKELLTSVKLDAIATQPLVECCRVDEWLH